MEAPPHAVPTRGGLAAWGAPVLAVCLALFAHRLLVAGALELPTPSVVGRWLFRPAALPPSMVLAAAAWLVWRRRGRLLALSAPSAPWSAAALAGLGAACFVWALLTRTPDLLFLSLTFHVLAFAALARGWPGCRVLSLPALVLLFGVRIPAPLLDELVWRLQLWTASGSAWLIERLGWTVVQGGVTLRDETHLFHVIDSCAGFQGIQILILVAILTRDIFARSGARQWLLVLLAPGIGFVLNLARIAAIVTSANPAALAGVEGDHTEQGVVVIVAGSAILYGLGWWMARRAEVGAAAPDASRSGRSLPWFPTAAWLAALAVSSALVTPFATSPVFEKIRFPEAGAGWSSEPLDVEPFFVGVPSGLRLDRRFELEERPRKVVDLFVGREDAAIPTSSKLLSSKFTWPGPEWDRVGSRRERLSSLGVDVDVTVASRPAGGEHAVVYTWQLRDRGLWRESWRSLLALEASPFRRERSRAVVRVVSRAPHDSALALDHAREGLDRFVVDFHDALSNL